MAFDLTAMADFAKSNGKVLITDLVIKGRSFVILPIQDGIKSSEKLIDFAENSTVLRTGDYSAADYQGGVKLTDKEIKVIEIFVKEAYKKHDLQKKIAQMALRAGSSPEDMPFQDLLVGLKGASIAAANESLLWKGSVAGGNLFDGFLTQLLAATDYTETNVAAADLSKTGAVDKVESVIELAFNTFPTWIDHQTRMFMSPKNFTTYFRAVNKLNGAVDKLTNEGQVITEFQIPGTNCWATSVSGLHGKPELILTRPENFVIGVDLKGEDEDFRFEYLNEALLWRYFALYKLGCKIARTNEVVVTGNNLA
jgi:hypothetical protein